MFASKSRSLGSASPGGGAGRSVDRLARSRFRSNDSVVGLGIYNRETRGTMARRWEERGTKVLRGLLRNGEAWHPERSPPCVRTQSKEHA